MRTTHPIIYSEFTQRRKEFLQAIHDTVVMEDIPAELVLNWDQTGVKLLPSSTWTMERKGQKRIEMVGTNDKRQITALLCATMPVVAFLWTYCILLRSECAKCLFASNGPPFSMSKEGLHFKTIPLAEP